MSLVTKLLINSRHCLEIFLKKLTNYFSWFYWVHSSLLKHVYKYFFHPIMKHLIFFKLHFLLWYTNRSLKSHAYQPGEKNIILWAKKKTNIMIWLDNANQHFHPIQLLPLCSTRMFHSRVAWQSGSLAIIYPALNAGAGVTPRDIICST